MNATQKIFRVRRNYNQWVNNQTLEDYALRFTAKSARKWSLFRVANTALGAISFLALEAIGGAITLSFGFDNASLAICVVGMLILLAGLPICYYAATYGVDIDLLTRGAGFGYIGSTVTSLIYASFTFIFFALEAAIMAMVLELMFDIPLALGYIICSVIILPIVTHGITLISQFQLWTQPLWVLLQILPFAWLFTHEWTLVTEWLAFGGEAPGAAATADAFGEHALQNEILNTEASGQGISLIYFGAASAVLFSLIAQIGEQVDFLRFLPEKNKHNTLRWWTALLCAGPGWIIIGVLKLFAGSLLAYVALQNGVSTEQASDPARMYTTAYMYIFQQPQVALALAGIFVIVSQLKINVTNAYAGSIAWSNFFSRLTHSHPGRVVWLVFNVVIALLLMELGVYQAFEDTLGVYAIVAVAWVGALVADLVINKPLGLSPRYIEFRRAYLHDINPVGVGAMVLGCAAGFISYLGYFGEGGKALAHFITLGIAFMLVPTIAILLPKQFYLARSASEIASFEHSHHPEPKIVANEQGECVCCICQNAYEVEDMAWCPAYDGSICSLCCSLDSRCQDSCKSVKKLNEYLIDFLKVFLPANTSNKLTSRFVHFSVLLIIVGTITAVLLSLVYSNATTGTPETDALLESTLWKVFSVLMIIAGVIVWLFILAHESKIVAQEESRRQNALFMDEIKAHIQTDRELQKAKEKAEAANNAKSRYLTGISHELRTPLNSILGYAQLLENDIDIPEEKREKLSVIRRSGEHLTDLIEGLLDISKIEAGRLDIHQDFVRIKSLLDQLVYMFRLQAEEKGLEFSYRCLSALPEFVRTDEKRLRQILINLLSNAIKFTERGRVEFSIRYRNHVAEILIRDSGVGIPPDELERVFLPFERVRRPGMPLVSGTGLGLTITRLLTELLGGDISVENNKDGGVTFKVLIMLARVTLSDAELPDQNKRIYGYDGRRRTIMVVDDEATHRGLISDLLSPLGFSVLEAPDAANCLEACEDYYPDIFLLDISMPDMDGTELARTLREKGCDKPIVMVSALASANLTSADNQYDETEKQIFYDDYLVKPVKQSSLLDKLGSLLQLNWVHEPLDKGHADTPALNEENYTFHQDEIPNKDVLKNLIELAEIGHLSGLKRKISQLAQSGEAGPGFTETLNAMVRNMQFKKIIQVLGDEH